MRGLYPVDKFILEHYKYRTILINLIERKLIFIIRICIVNQCMAGFIV